MGVQGVHECTYAQTVLACNGTLVAPLRDGRLSPTWVPAWEILPGLRPPPPPQALPLPDSAASRLQRGAPEALGRRCCWRVREGSRRQHTAARGSHLSRARGGLAAPAWTCGWLCPSDGLRGPSRDDRPVEGRQAGVTSASGEGCGGGLPRVPCEGEGPLTQVGSRQPACPRHWPP